MEFPVSNSFFPPLRLSPKETSAYFSKAQKAFDQVREALTTFSWKKIESKDGLVVGKVLCIDQHPSQVHAGKSTASMVLRATATVQATVAEIVDILSAQDTTTYRKDMRRLHGKNFLDGVTLASLDCGTRHSTCNVKWMAFKEAETSMDYCFLEYAGIVPGSSPIGFCVYQSIERLREVPSLGAMGFRREEFRRTGYIIQPRTDKPDHVVVTAIAQSAPSSTSERASERLEAWLNHRVSRVLVQLPDFVAMKRLGALPPVDKTQWIHDACRRFCAVCLKSFNFARKHHCRMCGEVVCGTCATSREVDLPTLGTSAFVRVCTVCVGRAHALASSSQASFNDNQNLAHDSFDLVDPNALGQPSDDDSDDSNHTDMLSDRSTTKRRASTRRPSSLDSSLYDESSEEIRNLHQEGLKLRTVSQDSSSSFDSFISGTSVRFHSARGIREENARKQQAQSPPEAESITVQELFNRVLKIRDTLNRNIPNGQTKILRENPRIALVDEEDPPEVIIESNEDNEEIKIETKMEDEDVQEKEDTKEGDKDDYLDEILEEVHEEVFNEIQMEQKEEEKKVEIPATTTQSSAEDMNELRSQISELHRLLASATERLQAVEAASTSHPPPTIVPHYERTVKYVELQSGNAMDDPVVAFRRRAHRAVVMELHEILGL